MLTGNQLEAKYIDIYETYRNIEKVYKTDVLSIHNTLKEKYPEFHKIFQKLFRKIINNSITENFLRTIIDVYENTENTNI